MSISEAQARQVKPETKTSSEGLDPSKYAVLMVDIVKTFPGGVVANNHITFDLRYGEIHGLLGENGAGKTTLMNILYGLYKPDSGDIYIKGRKVKLHSPKDAIRYGVGLVPQHFKLVEVHTVAENVILGLREYGFIIRMKEAEKKIKELADRYKFRINPRAKIWQLSMGERQYVEIIKALLRNVDILILDEPTTVLTPQESEQLFKVLRRMKEEGKSIIFITHKLDEALSLCDRITVLRKGRKVGTVTPDKVTKVDLAKMMVGREVLFRISKTKKELPKNKGPILIVKNLNVLSDKGILAVKNISFEIYPGEILGIAGIAGSGQEELAEAIAGLRKPISGKIIIKGKDVTRASPKEIFELKVAYIPEDRIRVGSLPNLSLWENLILRRHRYEPLVKKKLLLNFREIFKFAQERKKEYDIMAVNIFVPVRTLSGGNLQRMILASELTGEPDLIIAVYPTRGLDVGATEYVRKVLLRERDRGAAVLLISEELDEILQLSDRIAVIHNGEIMGIVRPEETTIEEIGLMMGGALKK